MTLKMVYFDDILRDRDRYKRRFEDSGLFDVIADFPPEKLSDLTEIEKINPDIFLVDLELSRPDKAGHVLLYDGKMLTTQLRKYFPAVPLILFTRPEIFEESFFIESESEKYFDEKIFKREIGINDISKIKWLNNLVIDFKKIKANVDKSFQEFLRATLKAPQIEFERLFTANPPLFKGEKILSSKRQALVPELVEWMRNVIIKYPGILYDSIHAATFLGISEKEFLSSEIKDLFKGAEYRGVFKPLEGRWWRSELHRIALDKMSDEEIDKSLNVGFPEACERIFKRKIEGAVCVYSGKALADSVCFILNKPVATEFSLMYYPDNRPAVMDEARISFKAIKETNKVNEDFFDEIGREIYTELRSIKG